MTRLPKQLERSEMDAAAAVHRASFDERLPWLAGLHTPEEDRAYFRNAVFEECEVWGMFEGPTLAGFIAFRDGWIDQLYVLPALQRSGLGQLLLEEIEDSFPDARTIRLEVEAQNLPAIAFYRKNGFVAQGEVVNCGGSKFAIPALVFEKGLD